MNAGNIQIDIIVNTSQATAGVQQVNVGLQGLAGTASGLQTQNVRLASSFQDVGLSAMGIQGALAILQQVKTVVMDLIGEANKLQATNLGLENVSKFKGIDSATVKASVQNLDLVKNGILSYGEAAQSVSNLMRSGLNLQQSIELLKGFTDSAVFGRQASLELGYAVVSGTEGWRNNNNMLLDNMGMTTNISVLNKRAGLSEEELANKVNDSTVATRQYDAVMKELALSHGNAALYAETFAGKQSQVNTQLTIAKQEAGLLLQTAITPLLDKTSKLVNVYMDLYDSTKRFIEIIPDEIVAINQLGLEILALPIDAFVWGMKSANNELQTFLQLWQTASQGKDNRPYGPELPPDFKRTGRGGEMEGIDYAGASTLNSKRNSGSKGKTAKEITTEYSRLKDEIKKFGSEFDLLKTQLTANGVQWNNNTEVVAGYIKKLEELNAKLKSMETDYSALVTARVNQGVGNLEGVTLPPPPGIGFNRSGSITPQQMYMQQRVMTQEEFDAAQKQAQNRIEGFSSGLSTLTNTIGLGDTAVGDFANALSSGLTILNSFFQMLNGGAGGGGWLGSLLGIGLSFIPGGGAAASAAGVLSGGGGGASMGGSIRGGYGYSGDVGRAIRSESHRVVERPYIASVTTDGDKMRVMLKEVELKHTNLSGRKT